MKIVLAHARRISNLASPSTRKNAVPLQEIPRMQAEYSCYVAGISEAVIQKDHEKIAQLVNGYRRYVKRMETEFLSPKSKYYSSILEELPVLLLRDRVELMLEARGLDSDEFSFGAVECCIGSVFSPDCVKTVERKCIDFVLSHHGDGISEVPLVGYEVKKYMDKTMFGTVLETYQSLTSQRPKTTYGFIVEDEARDREVVMNSKIYGSEFVLSGRMRNREELYDFPADNILRMEAGIVDAIQQNLDFFAETKLVRRQDVGRKRPGP